MFDNPKVKKATDELFAHLEANGSMDQITNILRRAQLGELKDAPAPSQPTPPLGQPRPTPTQPTPHPPTPPQSQPPPPTLPQSQHLTTQPLPNPPRTVQYLK
eukprot:g78940.t1